MSDIQIIYDDESYTVLYTNNRGVTSDIGYGDKHTHMEDHAQNFYELAAALNAGVTMKEAK